MAFSQYTRFFGSIYKRSDVRLFCRYCGASLAKAATKCSSCGKEQGPLFATNGYFGVLDKISEQGVKTEKRTKQDFPDNNNSKEPQNEEPAEKSTSSSVAQIGKGAVLLTVLMIACTLLLSVKISSLKKTLNENEVTDLDSLSQAVTRIEENQMRQDEVLDYLKQTVDTAKTDSESPILDEQNSDGKTQENEESASSTSTELKDDSTDSPVKTYRKQAHSTPDSVPPSIT